MPTFESLASRSGRRTALATAGGGNELRVNGKPSCGAPLNAPDQAHDQRVRRDIVVIGASAGGVEAIATLLHAMPADTAAAFFVVSHVLPESGNHLVDTLNTRGPLTAKHAEDGEEFRRGFVYVAPPDRHLLVKRDAVRVTRGPRENRWRPAIDPLFRSAAVAHGPRVIGIILSGMLDDGTAGLTAIKRCGGVAIVQDPDDAAFPQMPQTALANVEVDHRLPLSDMPPVVSGLISERMPPISAEPPADIVLEASIAETGYADEDMTAALGEITALSCPECAGPLWQRSEGGMPRFRCRVGHAYGASSLLSAQDEALEGSVWAAIRLFDQRANVLTAMAAKDRGADRSRLATHHETLATEARNHATALRAFLVQRNEPA
jgi:two-component system, chemotaxis family, protein-glutamate methylesterase/glutaminase